MIPHPRTLGVSYARGYSFPSYSDPLIPHAPLA